MQALARKNAQGATSNSGPSSMTTTLRTLYVLRQIISLLNHLFVLECRKDQGTGYIPSSDAVADHGWQQCRDPRDRVFEFQALVAPSHRVQVDYGKSTAHDFYKWAAETDAQRRHNPPNQSFFDLR